MRILILSQYFWPESFRVNDLVPALAARGHELTVLTGWPNYPDGTVFPDFRREPGAFTRFKGVEVLRVPLIPRGSGALRLVLNYAWFVLSASTIGLWKLRGRRFDAIFVYQPSPVTQCIPALVIGKAKRAPVLLWTLDVWPETLSAIGVVKSSLLLKLVGAMVSLIYRGCTLVLGQSRAFADNVARYAGDSKRFRYFPQWSEPLFERGLDDVEPAEEVSPFEGTFNVLFAGNIGEAQDFPAILDAAERLRKRDDIRWLIVGDGRAGDWVRCEVTRRGLERTVHLLGRYPIERMPSFFKGASALLVTLKREPTFALVIPGKVQTYLATGLPVLGMLDGEGARVLNESGGALTCAAGDAAGLAHSVELMAAKSANELAAMGVSGQRYAAQQFDRERLVTQLEGWLTEAALQFNPPKRCAA